MPEYAVGVSRLPLIPVTFRFISHLLGFIPRSLAVALASDADGTGADVGE